MFRDCHKLWLLLQYEEFVKNLSKEGQRKFNAALDFLFSQVYLLSFVTYGLWIFVGTIFYTFNDEWTSATGFYYAIEAGLNVGFCSPVEKTDGSKIFTVLFFLIGSSLIAGCLGFFISHVTYSHSLVAELPEECLKTICDTANKITIRSILNFISSNLKYYCGWDQYSSIVKTGIFFLLWIIWGTIYAVHYEGWSIITSIYWAVTSAATGGLQSPPCIASTNAYECDIGNSQGIAIGIFLMVAVPLYGYFFAQIAGLVIAEVVNRRERELLHSPIEEQEFVFVSEIFYSKSEHLPPSTTSSDAVRGGHALTTDEVSMLRLSEMEYIVLELLRLGATSQDQIVACKTHFSKLDSSCTGRLYINDLKQKGEVISHLKTPQQLQQQVAAATLMTIIPSQEFEQEYNSSSSSGNSSYLEQSPSQSDIHQPTSYSTQYQHQHHRHDTLIDSTNSIGSTTTSSGDASISSTAFVYSVLRRSVKSVKNNLYLFTFIIYILWTMVGTLFYYYYDNWTLATSYYFAMNAGLCVGMCGIVEVDDYSRLFTIGYVLFGSIFVSGYLGMVISAFLFEKPIVVCKEYTLAAMSIYKTNKSTGQRYISCHSVMSYVCYLCMYTSGYLTNPGKTKLIVMFVVWIAFGIMYSMLYIQYDFLTGLYFAVTTMSTGGLTGPKCAAGFNATCDLGTFNAVVMGVFMQVGIPLYAATLGLFANNMINRAIRMKERKLLKSPIYEIDFEYIAKLLSATATTTMDNNEVDDYSSNVSSSNSSLNIVQFVLLCLLRLQATNVDQVLTIREKYQLLILQASSSQSNNTGGLDAISLSDLKETGHVVSPPVRIVDKYIARSTASKFSVTKNNNSTL